MAMATISSQKCFLVKERLYILKQAKEDASYREDQRVYNFLISSSKPLIIK